MMRLKVSLATESMRKTHDSQFTTLDHVSGVNPFMQVPPQQQHQFNNITILNAYKAYAASEIEKNNVTSKKGKKSTVVIPGKKRSIKGISMAKSTLLDLIKRLGADIEMWRVTNDVIEQKWVNTRLKENTHKGKPPELTTLKRDLSFIRTFFAWGAEIKRRYCEKLDIFIDATSSPCDKFTAADLQKIFTVLPTLAAKPWQFWVPLIQLYTGARIGEPSALSVDHFRNEAGIEVMHLPGTKSDSAARDIPIHPDLIKLTLVVVHFP